jgi:hypothetical protein
VAAVLSPGIAEPSPPWRHALFAVINAGCALGFQKPFPGFTWAFAALVVQQIYSHGTQVIGNGRLDWASAAVFVGLPAAGLLLKRNASSAIIRS